MNKLQTGLIFKPEKPRAGKDEYLAQHLQRVAFIAGRVYAMSADAVFENPDSPWIELRDTITNYPVRYKRGEEIQRRMRQPARPFRWQTKMFTPNVSYFREARKK